MGGDAGEDERTYVCVCGREGGGMWERVKEVGGMQE